MSLSAGRLLGPYRIVSPLGAGGMGEVYRARDSRLERDVALKILPPEVAGSEDRRRRFELEARSASALNHPNIVSVYDIGSDGDLFYIVSELVSGESLRSLVRQGAMSIRRLLEIAVQVAEGLSASHAAGILHRDLKPENIMIAKNGRVKILDFGLAKQIPSGGEGGLTHASTLTAAQHLVGTPGYMSPEQIRQQPLDVRSDIFSFGCVLYEMATGRRAFSGPSAVEIMHATVAQDPSPLSSSSHPIPVALDRIIHRCLEKEPARRFQTASDLAFALQSAPESSASGTGPAPTLPPAPHRDRRLLLGLAAGTALLAGAAYWVAARLHPPAPATFQRLTFRLGSISEVVLSPDGRTVVYQAKWEDTPSRFYSLTIGQREARDVDPGPATRLFSLSSKGELAIGMGPYGSGRTLARVPVTGGPPREVLNGVLAADWTPDGQSLAVMRRVGKKDRVEFQVGKVLFETDISDFHYNPIRFSPDGKRIAFVHMAGLQALLAVADVDERIHQLGALAPNGNWQPGPITWSPDGKEIWLRSYRDTGVLLAIDLAGSSRVVTRLPGSFDLVAVTREGKALLQMDKQHGGILALGPGQERERDLSWAEDNGYPRISADGRLVVFTCGGEGGGQPASVILRNTDGSPGLRLADGVAMGGISPDGKWVNIRPGVSPQKEVLIPTGPGEEIDVNLPRIGSATIVYWLPDGKSYIVMGNAPGEQGRYWYWQPSSRTVRPLSHEVENGRPSALKPDGTELVLRLDDGYRSVSLPSGDARSFPGFEDGDRTLVWSSDAKAIYFLPASQGPTSASFSVWRLDLATRRRSFWKQITPSKSVDHIGLHLTPNGCCYVYAYDRTLSDLYLANGFR